MNDRALICAMFGAGVATAVVAGLTLGLGLTPEFRLAGPGALAIRQDPAPNAGLERPSAGSPPQTQAERSLETRPPPAPAERAEIAPPAAARPAPQVPMESSGSASTGEPTHRASDVSAPQSREFQPTAEVLANPPALPSQSPVASPPPPQREEPADRDSLTSERHPTAKRPDNAPPVQSQSRVPMVPSLPQLRHERADPPAQARESRPTGEILANPPSMQPPSRVPITPSPLQRSEEPAGQAAEARPDRRSARADTRLSAATVDAPELRGLLAPDAPSRAVAMPELRSEPVAAAPMPVRTELPVVEPTRSYLAVQARVSEPSPATQAPLGTLEFPSTVSAQTPAVRPAETAPAAEAVRAAPIRSTSRALVARATAVAQAAPFLGAAPQAREIEAIAEPHAGSREAAPAASPREVAASRPQEPGGVSLRPGAPVSADPAAAAPARPAPGASSAALAPPTPSPDLAPRPAGSATTNVGPRRHEPEPRVQRPTHRSRPVATKTRKYQPTLRAHRSRASLGRQVVVRRPYSAPVTVIYGAPRSYGYGSRPVLIRIHRGRNGHVRTSRMPFY
jgi:hypothetical protein